MYQELIPEGAMTNKMAAHLWIAACLKCPKVWVAVTSSLCMACLRTLVLWWFPAHYTPQISNMQFLLLSVDKRLSVQGCSGNSNSLKTACKFMTAEGQYIEGMCVQELLNATSLKV